MKRLNTFIRNSLQGFTRVMVVGLMLLMGLASFGLTSSATYAVGPCTPDPSASPPVTCPPAGAGGGAGGSAVTSACSGVATLGVTCDSSGDAQSVISGPIKSLIKLLSFAVGVACVVMIIFGGFKFITSQGNSDGTKSARDTIIYALIGLVVVLLVNVLITFVFNQTKEISGSTGSGATPTPTTTP